MYVHSFNKYLQWDNIFYGRVSHTVRGKNSSTQHRGGINWTNTVGHRFCAPWNDFLVCNNSYQSPSRVPGRTKEPMAFPFRRRQQEGQKRHIHPSLAAVPNVPPSIMSLQARPWSAPLSTGTIAQRQRSGTLFFLNFESHALSTTPKAERDRTRPCASSASNRGKIVAIGNQRVNATQRTTCPFLSRKLAEQNKLFCSLLLRLRITRRPACCFRFCFYFFICLSPVRNRHGRGSKKGQRAPKLRYEVILCCRLCVCVCLF